MWKKAVRVLLLLVVGVLLAATAPGARAQSAADACSLLTPAQVSAAVGAQVSAGTYMTPDFKATCNWTAKGIIVTLMTEGTDKYQAGKKPVSPIMNIVSAPGIGDDAYFVVVQTTVALFTKKGNAAFKTTVYSKLPIDKLEAMESAMAKQVAGEL